MSVASDIYGMQFYTGHCIIKLFTIDLKLFVYIYEWNEQKL